MGAAEGVARAQGLVMLEDCEWGGGGEAASEMPSRSGHEGRWSWCDDCAQRYAVWRDWAGLGWAADSGATGR